MKKLNAKQFSKHFHNAIKNAYVVSYETYNHPTENDIIYNVVKLSNDIEIKKTYFNNVLRFMYIDKKSANDLNCYHFKNGYIEKA